MFFYARLRSHVHINTIRGWQIQWVIDVIELHFMQMQLKELWNVPGLIEFLFPMECILFHARFKLYVSSVWFKVLF